MSEARVWTPAMLDTYDRMASAESTYARCVRRYGGGGPETDRAWAIVLSARADYLAAVREGSDDEPVR